MTTSRGTPPDPLAAVGFEPNDVTPSSDNTSNTPDVTTNAESNANPLDLTQLARQLANLTPEDRAKLAALLNGGQQ